jgi:hypothetical protein
MPRKSWWARLPFGVRMTAGASAVLVAIGGGTAGIATLTEDEPHIAQATGVTVPPAAAPPVEVPDTAAAPEVPAEAGLGDLVARVGGGQPVGERADTRTSEQADRTAPRPAHPAATAPAAAPARPAEPARPVVTTRTVLEKRAIPYRTRLIRDPNLPRGRKRVQTEGIPGEETLSWMVTYADGQPTDKRLIGTDVTREPQHRVVAFGTRRGKGDGSRDCRPGADNCFRVGRSAACPQRPEAGTPDLPDGEFYLLTPEDLDGLALDPQMVC